MYSVYFGTGQYVPNIDLHILFCLFYFVHRMNVYEKKICLLLYNLVIDSCASLCGGVLGVLEHHVLHVVHEGVRIKFFDLNKICCLHK